MSNPIPIELVEEFVAYMKPFDLEDLKYDTWIDGLENAAGEFMKSRGLDGSATDAAHQYLDEADSRAS